MEVIVLGGGVIGVTSAYFLAKAGFKVTVIERQANVALETSFANAGQITPALSSPWAAPGVPLKAMKWIFQRHSPLTIKLTPQKFQYSWMLNMLANCNQHSFKINKERMLRIARYSQQCLQEVVAENSFDYDERKLGTLHLFRDSYQFESGIKNIDSLIKNGVNCKILNPNDVLQVEPGLASAKINIVGGVHLPNDQTGDCYKFTFNMAEVCKNLGVKFLFNTSVLKIESNGNQIKKILLDDGSTIKADYYVVALGSFSREILRELKIDIPVYPLKGYSITTDIINPSLSPVSTILDETYKVAITRFNNRIRVGGMAEICGFNTELNSKREQTLKMVLTELFPKSSNLTKLNFWTGFRPTTPDGTPIIGRTSFQNLLINTGHGTLGWTMACGSGQLIADIIAGHDTKIKHEDLSYKRYI